MGKFKEHVPVSGAERLPPVAPVATVTTGASVTTGTPGKSRPRAPAPLPKVEDAKAEARRDAAKPAADVDPTRYGDWEINGRCIDF
ncbi:MAG: DUF1674 domain-containing protein [Alphaproteobacteria bacterium]